MICPICRQPLTQPARGRKRRYCSRSCQARAYRARRGASAAPRRPPRPARLTAVGIARAAVALADRDGIDGLSMRRLASELGVATAAIYRYVPDRETLLANMTELVLAENSPPPSKTVDWRAQLTREAEQEWRLYQRHPWMLPVLARIRPPMGPALFDLLERSFTALDQLGMSRQEVLTTYLAISGLVQGLALLWSSEHTDRLGGAESLTAEVRADLAELIDPATRPMMHKHFAAGPPGPELDFDDILAAGLGLLLDGIAARRSR